MAYLQLAALPTAPSWARRHTRTALQAWELWQETIDTAELLVSELVTNASKAACTNTQTKARAQPTSLELISLALRYTPGGLVIEVFDADKNPPVQAGNDIESENGRGLLLVDTLSKDWGYTLHQSGGKTVYCLISTQS